MSRHAQTDESNGSYRDAAQYSLYSVALLYAISMGIAIVTSNQQEHPYVGVIGGYIFTIVVCGALILFARKVGRGAAIAGTLALLSYLLFQILLAVALSAGGGYSAGLVLFVSHLVYAASVIVAWLLVIRAWIKEQ